MPAEQLRRLLEQKTSLKKLIALDAEINISDISLISNHLKLAIEFSREDLFKYLLDRTTYGFDTNVFQYLQCSDADTPLHMLCRNPLQNIKLLKMYVQRFISPPTSPNHEHQTELDIFITAYNQLSPKQQNKVLSQLPTDRPFKFYVMGSLDNPPNLTEKNIAYLVKNELVNKLCVYAIDYNKLSMFDVLFARFRSNYLTDYYRAKVIWLAAAASNQLPVMKKIYDSKLLRQVSGVPANHPNISTEITLALEAWQLAAEKGHLDTLKWLYQEYAIECRKYEKYANQRLEALRDYSDSLKPTIAAYPSFHLAFEFALLGAAANRQEAVLEWLLTEPELAKCYEEVHFTFICKRAAHYGYKGLIKTLLRHVKSEQIPKLVKICWDYALIANQLRNIFAPINESDSLLNKIEDKVPLVNNAWNILLHFAYQGDTSYDDWKRRELGKNFQFLYSLGFIEAILLFQIINFATEFGDSETFNWACESHLLSRLQENLTEKIVTEAKEHLSRTVHLITTWTTNSMFSGSLSSQVVQQLVQFVKQHGHLDPEKMIELFSILYPKNTIPLINTVLEQIVEVLKSLNPLHPGLMNLEQLKKLASIAISEKTTGAYMILAQTALFADELQKSLKKAAEKHQQLSQKLQETQPKKAKETLEKQNNVSNKIIAQIDENNHTETMESSVTTEETTQAIDQLQSRIEQQDNLKDLESILKQTVGQKNINGDTALHITVLYKRYDAADYLLTHKLADVNARNKEGFTPLHYATATKSITMVRLLSRHGAEHLANKNRKYPVHIAISVKASEILDYFSTTLQTTSPNYLYPTLQLQLELEKAKLNVNVTSLDDIVKVFDDTFASIDREKPLPPAIQDAMLHVIILLDTIKKSESFTLLFNPYAKHYRFNELYELYEKVKDDPKVDSVVKVAASNSLGDAIMSGRFELDDQAPFEDGIATQDLPDLKSIQDPIQLAEATKLRNKILFKRATIAFQFITDAELQHRAQNYLSGYDELAPLSANTKFDPEALKQFVLYYAKETYIAEQICRLVDYCQDIPSLVQKIQQENEKLEKTIVELTKNKTIADAELGLSNHNNSVFHHSSPDESSKSEENNVTESCVMQHTQ